MIERSDFLPEFNEYDVSRLYSLSSDENQMKFDLVTLSVYQEMGLVGDINLDEQTPGLIAEKILETKLTDEQKQEYALKFVQKIVVDDNLFKMVPPRVLTNAYIAMRDLKKQLPDDAELSDNFKTIESRIDELIENFAKYYDLYIADTSNIADIYNGYNEMCNARRETLGLNSYAHKHTRHVAKNINTVKSRLDKIVQEYQELWNLTNLSEKDATALDARWNKLSEKLKDVEINDDLLITLSKYKFLDENCKSIPQFIDEHGKARTNFRPGLKLNPNSRLARIISLAKNDVAMQNVGKITEPVKDINLTNSVSERVNWKIAEIETVDKVVRDATGKEKTKIRKISDTGYQAALDAQVNQVAGFVGMLSDKIGRDASVLTKPFQAIEDIDRLAKSRTEKVGAQQRKQKIGFFKSIAKNFGMAATVSAGLTFLAKATGIAALGAAIGTSIGIANMAYQGMKWRREQKKLGNAYGIREFFADKRNWGPAVASGLGIAATISIATGNLELATGFGLGAMAVGGGSSATMLYKDAMNAGYTRTQALAGALGVVGATVLGGLTGRIAMDGFVNYVNNNTDSNLFKSETLQTTQTETVERGYADGVIEHNEQILQQWETPQQLETRINGLMNAGLSYDDAVRYLLAWHDATDHNLGNGYFKSIGLDVDTMNAFRSSINGNEINLSHQAIAVFEQFNPHISTFNQVGYVDGAPISHDLPANAAYGANGEIVSGKDFYSTYTNHGEEVFAYNKVVNTQTQHMFTPNELSYPAGMGTFGIYEERVQKIIDDNNTRQIKERIGALADKGVVKKQKPVNTETQEPVVAEIPQKPKVDEPKVDEPNKFTERAHYVIKSAYDWTQGLREKISAKIAEHKAAKEQKTVVAAKPKTATATETTDKPKETNNVTPARKPGKFTAHVHYVIDTLWDWRDYWNKRKIQGTKIEIEQEKLKTKKQIEQIRQQEKLEQEKQKQKIKEQKRKKQMNIEQMKNETAIEHENARLEAARQSVKLAKRKGEIAREQATALAVIKQEKETYKSQLEQDKIKSEIECETRIARLATLAKEVQVFREMGKEDAVSDLLALQEMQNKLDVLREQGKQQVIEAGARAKTNRVREFGQRFIAFFRGTRDVSDADIANAKKALELAQSRLTILQTEKQSTVVKGQINSLEKAIKTLSWYVGASALSDEEKQDFSQLVKSIYNQIGDKQK